MSITKEDISLLDTAQLYSFHICWIQHLWCFIDACIEYCIFIHISWYNTHLPLSAGHAVLGFRCTVFHRIYIRILWYHYCLHIILMVVSITACPIVFSYRTHLLLYYFSLLVQYSWIQHMHYFSCMHMK